MVVTIRLESGVQNARTREGRDACVRDFAATEVEVTELREPCEHRARRRRLSLPPLVIGSGNRDGTAAQTPRPLV